MERARGEYSPRALQEMRSASRSPNKRSVTGECCLDEQEQGKKQEERQAPVRADELLVLREGGEGGGSGGGFGVFGVPPAPPSSSSSLVTPFKRFRADSLISPPKAGSSTGGSGTHGLFARRRAGPAFQSLSRDQSATTATSTATATTTRTAITVLKSNVRAATNYGVDSDCSTQQSSQQSSQGDSMLFKGRECSPADVAELGSELLVCFETLEDQMDALDVGSFLSWRASPHLQQGDRTAFATTTTSSSSSSSSSSAAAAAALRHRRKPRIRFDDDASYEIGLQDVFGEQTQEEDPLEELEDPLEVFVHLPSVGCCNCLCSDNHHDHEDLERSWQVPSPPPDAGFDPRSCSLDSDFDSDDDTVNESPFDAF